MDELDTGWRNLAAFELYVCLQTVAMTHTRARARA